jgi:hypothetical protein
MWQGTPTVQQDKHVINGPAIIHRWQHAVMVCNARTHGRRLAMQATYHVLSNKL